MNKTFSDQQLSSIILGLEKGDIPVKYSYITKQGSKARSKIEKSRTIEGQSFSDALLLKNSIEIYLQELGGPKELAIFDFGCGTGETVKETLLKLGKMGIKVKYHAFDISQNIINLCKNNISNINNCEFNYSIIDFEISNLVDILYNIRSKYKNIPVLGLLLGNTVGNFNSMERILTNILEAFRIGDRLCIGIERSDINNKRRFDNMINIYQSKAVFNIASATIKELNFDLKNGRYYVNFNERLSSIEGFFIIEKDFSIKINNKTINFKVGEKIRIVQSKKIDESGFSKLFLDLDMRIANIRTNESNSYLQALISSKKY
ncbi:L-histidine N(alpha)-methyltransferase [Candidatus Gracilibacteria bacterium]|nr:L-histidine N(alpha)-methyltransferase [Candidatus Gracilibacteria bacterium]